MPVLTDIANELDRYPLDETTIEIIDVAREGSANDPDINDDETWKFKVKVTNNGHINMTGVSLHVQGLNGTLVSEDPVTGFANDMVVASLNPPGGGESRQTKFFYFKPGTAANPPVNTPLLNAHIHDWGANFDHYFSNHTKDETAASDIGIVYPRVTHSAVVFPG